MAVVAGNPVWVTLTTDANTPANLQQYAGRIIGLPQGTVAPAGYDVLTVNGINIPGRAQLVDGQWQWVMGPPADPLVAALDAIPGAAGWVDVSARNVYRDQGLVLIRDYGVPGTVTVQGLQRFHDAAVLNYRASTGN